MYTYIGQYRQVKDKTFDFGVRIKIYENDFINIKSILNARSLL